MNLYYLHQIMNHQNILRNKGFEASKLGISFYQMIFLLIQKDMIHNKKFQN